MPRSCKRDMNILLKNRRDFSRRGYASVLAFGILAVLGMYFIDPSISTFRYFYIS